MNKIDDGGPAFPAQFFDERATGMTMRDYFAGNAMQGELSALWSEDGSVSGVNLDASDHSIEQLAKHWYRLADAMLAARKEQR